MFDWLINNNNKKISLYILSHQSILVDVCPLHLLCSWPSQHHGPAQDVQVLLQQQRHTQTLVR